jgi:hypothetical protein
MLLFLPAGNAIVSQGLDLTGQLQNRKYGLLIPMHLIALEAATFLLPLFYCPFFRIRSGLQMSETGYAGWSYSLRQSPSQPARLDAEENDVVAADVDSNLKFINGSISDSYFSNAMNHISAIGGVTHGVAAGYWFHW